jgi:hypothetical protein
MLKVADLQRFIDGLAQPMKSAGANQKVLDDLARLSQGLERFKERSIGEFNEFLETADRYITDGTLPEPGRRPSSRSRADAAPRVSVEEAAQRVLSLRERAAADASMDVAVIESELQPLSSLTVAQLKQAAEQANLSAPNRVRSKEELLRAMATSIKEGKRAPEPTGQPTEGELPSLNRPPSEPRAGGHAEAAHGQPHQRPVGAGNPGNA